MTCSGSSTASTPTNDTVEAAGNTSRPYKCHCIYSGHLQENSLPLLSQSLSSSLPLSLDADRAAAAPGASGRGGCVRLSPPPPPPIAPFPYSAPPLFAQVASLLPTLPPSVLAVDRFLHLRFHSSRARSTLPPAERERGQERGRDGRVPDLSRAALSARPSPPTAHRPTPRSCRPAQICCYS